MKARRRELKGATRRGDILVIITPSQFIVFVGCVVLGAICILTTGCGESDAETIQGYPEMSDIMREHGVVKDLPVEVSAVATAQVRHEASPKPWIAPWLRPDADETIETICPENTFSRKWVKSYRPGFKLRFGVYSTNEVMERYPHGLIQCSVGLGLVDGMPAFEMRFVTPVPTGDYQPPQFPPTPTPVFATPTPTPMPNRRGT